MKGHNARSRRKVNCSKSPITRRLMSLIFKRKAAAQKLRRDVWPTRVTRTVELAGTENVGKSSKLLFVLALGLTPKLNEVHRNPRVRMEKLDPTAEKRAKEKTKKRIHRIFVQRHVWLRRNAINIQAVDPVVKTYQPEPEVNVVDLVSSSDDESSSDDNPELRIELVPQPPDNRPSQTSPSGNVQTHRYNSNYNNQANGFCGNGKNLENTPSTSANGVNLDSKSTPNWT